MKIEKRKGVEINHIEVLWNYNNTGDNKSFSIFNIDDLFEFYVYFKDKMGSDNKGFAFVNYYNKPLFPPQHLTECNNTEDFLDFVGDLANADENTNDIGIIFHIH